MLENLDTFSHIPTLGFFLNGYCFFITAKLIGALILAEIALRQGVSLVSLLAHKRIIALFEYLVPSFDSRLSVFPVGNIVLTHFEATYPAEPDVKDVDGIIVLGGGGNLDVWQRGSPELGEEVTDIPALELYRRHPKSIIVLLEAWRLKRGI